MSHAHLADQLSKSGFSKWAKRMTADSRKDSSHPQRLADLVSQIKAGHPQQFAAWMRKASGLPVLGQADGLPDLPRRLTAREAERPSPELCEQIADHFGERVSGGLAALPAFWAACHLFWLDQGQLGADWLAQIATAGDDREITRRFLRWIGGADISIRGRFSPLARSPISRAWWQHRLAHQIADHSQLEPRQVLQRLTESSSLWEELLHAEVNRVTALTDPRLRAAWVETYLRSDMTLKQLRDWLNEIARMGNYWSYPTLNPPPLPPIPTRKPHPETLPNLVLPTLKQFCADHPNGQLTITTGSLTASGLLLVADLIGERPCRIITGWDPSAPNHLRHSEAEALRTLLNRPSLTILAAPTGQRLHMKTWIVSDLDDQPIAGLNGSANLSATGLNRNMEAMTVIPSAHLPQIWEQVQQLVQAGSCIKHQLLPTETTPKDPPT